MVGQIQSLERRVLPPSLCDSCSLLERDENVNERCVLREVVGIANRHSEPNSVIGINCLRSLQGKNVSAAPSLQRASLANDDLLIKGTPLAADELLMEHGLRPSSRRQNASPSSCHNLYSAVNTGN
jgi:hypothetical protein